MRLVFQFFSNISQGRDKTIPISILLHHSLTSLNMAPPFVPEDEELLLDIRKTIKNHRKSTWKNTTKLYNILVPSRVQRTQDSLQNRYKIMNVEQAQRRAQGNCKSVLEDNVLLTFHKMLNMSMYAAEYPDLAIRKSSGTRARTQTAGTEPRQTRSKVNTCFTHPQQRFH
jgi:hypothetical protein